MVNAQEWLDQNYPQENREQITELKIRQRGLEGELDLTDFTNLEVLDCLLNKLTHLDVSNCENLAWLNCYSNKLTNDTLILPSQSENLTRLFLRSNEFTSLNIFGNLVNLQVLELRGNLLISSNLRDLSNCNKLETFSVSGTKILPNWEYLHKDIEVIKRFGNRYDGSEYQALDDYQKGSIFSYDIEMWRKENQEIVNLANSVKANDKSIDELKTIKNTLKSAISSKGSDFWINWKDIT